MSICGVIEPEVFEQNSRNKKYLNSTRCPPPTPRGTNYVNPPICISVNTIILFSPKVNYSASEFGIHVRISSFIFDGDEMDVQTKVDKE